jgi:hypothetical protein
MNQSFVIYRGRPKELEALVYCVLIEFSLCLAGSKRHDCPLAVDTPFGVFLLDLLLEAGFETDDYLGFVGP